MSATKTERESESEEDEDEPEVDEEKKKKKKKSSPEKNVTYFGGIGISDSRRTQLAYVSVALSLTGIILAVFLFINGLREDGYLSDFSDLVKGYSGGGIFTMMMVVGVMAGVIQLFGCHICFRATISVERKKLYYWIWVYVMALIVLLIAFVIANLVGLLYWLSAHSAFKGGLHDSMKLYESRLKVKSAIDRMQIDFQCCGSRNYKDWWNVGWWGVRWLDTSSREVKKKMKDGRTYLTDSVPFSCCDPRVRRPCVHHSMLNSFQHTKYDSSNVTVYEIGCTRAMSRHYAATVSSFLKLLVASLIIELSLTVTFRYLQTSTGTAIEEDEMDAETRGYLWTTSKKPSTQKQPTAADTGGEASASKGVKTPVASKAGAAKKGAAKSAKDKNRNNTGPNNNNVGSMQGNYNNMAVEQVSRHAESATRTLPRADARTTRQAPVTRMSSNATVSTSRQTSSTNFGGSRQTSGTRLTVTTHDSDGSQRSMNMKSVSRQQSQNSVATRSSASTSGVQPSAAGSSSYASTIRQVPNTSRNNNVSAAPESSSTSVADQQALHSESTSALPAQVHQPQQQKQQQQQQQQQLVAFDVHSKRSTPPVVHSDPNNTGPKQRPEVPRPLTPVPIPEVHPAKMASLRLPRSVPLADYLVSPRSRSSRSQTGNSNISNANPQTCVRAMQHDRSPARPTGWNRAAMQPPLASVHKPVVAQSLTNVHRPSNYCPVTQSLSVPPPLPPRNASITKDSPYVTMYPLRPPRNHSATTRPRGK